MKRKLETVFKWMLSGFVAVLLNSPSFTRTPGPDRGQFPPVHTLRLTELLENRDFYRTGFQTYIGEKRKALERGRQIVNSLEPGTALHRLFLDQGEYLAVVCDDYDAGIQPTLPTLSFTEELTLDVGDMTLFLVHFGPGFHTGGDILIGIPTAGVVISGDIIARDDPLAESLLNARSDFSPWISCLKRILVHTRDVKHVVTSHFGILPGQALPDFLCRLQEMEGEQRSKRNAVEYLRAASSTTDLFRRIGQFEERFIQGKHDEYYVWEREMIALRRELQKGRKNHEAIAVLKLAASLSPRSTTVFNMLGAAHRRAGNHPAAIRAYRACLKNRPRLLPPLPKWVSPVFPGRPESQERPSV